VVAPEGVVAASEEVLVQGWVARAREVCQRATVLELGLKVRVRVRVRVRVHVRVQVRVKVKVKAQARVQVQMERGTQL